jgi:hypothetical protein
VECGCRAVPLRRRLVVVALLFADRHGGLLVGSGRAQVRTLGFDVPMQSGPPRLQSPLLCLFGAALGDCCHVGGGWGSSREFGASTA